MNIPVAMRGFIVPTAVLTVALAMMAVETLQAGRRWPNVRGWWLRAILLNSVQVGAVWIAGVGWNGWMLQHRTRDSQPMQHTARVLHYLLITVWDQAHSFQNLFNTPRDCGRC